MLKIGEKIKELRKSQDVTQEKLADFLNISYQAVSKWENGLAMPDITYFLHKNLRSAAQGSLFPFDKIICNGFFCITHLC